MVAPLSRVEIGAPAPDFVLPSATGRRLRLSAFRGRVTVLEWTNPVCPFTTKKYAQGAIQAVQRAATQRGAVWLAIDTAARGKPGWLSPAAARARVAQARMSVSGFLFDESGDVGRLYGAKATPAVYIVGPDGRLLFQGAVDEDAWATTPPAALSLVRDALDEIFARRPVRKPETRQYGCPVEY